MCSCHNCIVICCFLLHQIGHFQNPVLIPCGQCGKTAAGHILLYTVGHITENGVCRYACLRLQRPIFFANRYKSSAIKFPVSQCALFVPAYSFGVYPYAVEQALLSLRR